MNCKNCGREIFPPKSVWCDKKCMKEYDKSPERRYSQYKVGAMTRGKSFELTFDQFKRFWQVPCHYCGDKIFTIGLDRVDNTRGYFVDNIVSCCWKCNQFKCKDSVSEFVARCERIVKNIRQ